MVRDLNAACPLDRVGKQYDGNPEATKRERSESLHMATRQVGERSRSAARDLGLSIGTDFIASPLHRVVMPAARFTHSMKYGKHRYGSTIAGRSHQDCRHPLDRQRLALA